MHAWLTAAASFLCQDPELGSLRQAFEGMAEVPRVAIAVVPGREPVILASGRHAGGAPVDERSLLPLGAAVRLLVADAVHFGRRVDGQRVLIDLAEEPLRVQDVLGGSSRVPDWFAWRAVEHTPDRAAIERCVQIAAAAGRTFRCDALGMGEVALLEPSLLGEHAPDLATALRVHLAPHVPGLDPRDVRTLGEAARRVLAPDPAALRAQAGDAAARGDGAGRSGGLAAAEPAALRLVLSAKEIASWWQWRVQRPQPMWQGARTSGFSGIDGRDGAKQWELYWAAPSAVGGIVVCADPSAVGGKGVVHGAVLAFGVDPDGTRTLTRALEQDLLGPPEAVAEEIRFGVGLGGRLGTLEILGPLRDSSWVPRDGGEELRIDVIGPREKALQFRVGDRVLATRSAWRSSDTGFEVDLGADEDGVRHRLVLHLVEEPARELHAVWLRSLPDVFALPRPLVFVPAK